jgi:hypothetical protein
MAELITGDPSLLSPAAVLTICDLTFSLDVSALTR